MKRTTIALCSGLLLLALSICFCTADGGPGARVAEKHLAFVKHLSTENIRLATDLKDIAKEIEEGGCTLSASVSSRMDARQAKFAKLYAKEYCQTWQKFWDKALGPCDRDRPPDWCDDEAAISDRVDLKGYFVALVRGLDAAGSPIERDNIMDIVLSTLGAHIITEFPKDQTESWATAALVAYLSHASPPQAIEVARDLKKTWIGLSPRIAEALESYLTTASSMSGEQRNTLLHILAREDH